MKFISTPKNKTIYTGTFDNPILDKSVDATDDKMCVKFKELFPKVVNGIFAHKAPVTTTYLKYISVPITFENCNERDFEVILHPDESYIKQKNVKDTVVEQATHVKDNVVNTVSDGVKTGAKVASDAAKTAG